MSEDFVPPSVTIVSPSNGARVAGLVAVTAKAWDDVGVNNVTFQAQGLFIGVLSEPPYKVLWNTTRFANGPVTLTAHAYDDAGNQSLASSVQVMVSNPAHSTAPVVTLVQPSEGASLTGALVTIAGEAEAPHGSARLHVTINGVIHLSAENVTNIQYHWNLNKAASGQHRIAILAEYGNGYVGEASVTVEKL